MIDPKLVENWNIVFALAEKGCGYFASYEAEVWDPRLCGGPLDNVQWVLTVPCPAGCISSPPPGIPTNPPPCDPDYNGSPPATMVGCCEGIVQVECTGTCCKCGGVDCGATQTCCDNVCVDLQTDHDHCSSCTIACEPSETCCAGDCIDTASLQTDVANCGYCGHPCLAGESCCSGSCVNVMGSDTSNCGYCGNPCASGKICHNGVCKDPCAVNSCSWTWNSIFGNVCDTDPCGSQNWKFVYGTQTSVSGGITYYTGSDWVVTSDCNADGVDYICTGGNRPAAVGTCGDTLAPYNDWLCQGVETVGVDCMNGYGEITGTGLCFDSPCNCAPKACTCDTVAVHWDWTPPDPCPPTPDGWNSTDTCPPGCNKPQPDFIPDDMCSTYQYDTFCECPPPPISGGSWSQTSTCPSLTCNCPGEAPTADGTDGQVVTYECASCVPECGEGQECCGGECKNTNDDNANCGGCGIPCLFPLGFCCNGECCTEDGCCTVNGTPTCKDIYNDPDFCGDCVTFCSGPGSTTPQTCCDGECKDLRTDPNNCRYCGSVCAEGETCCYNETAWGCQNIKDSTFNCGSCNFQCAFDPALNIQCCNYECIPLNVSVNHCGSCYHPCGINETCCNGNCCPAGNTCCNGNCVNRNTDNNNCGNCGTVCVGGHSCVNGVCLACNPPCLAAGTACCNNSCIDIWSDESNCGSCGYACAPGLTCCGGVCKNLLNDMYNCGDCGIECPQGINQINLWQCCNGQCKNLKTDPDNCGICGLTCYDPPGDTFTVPKCFLGNCAEPECECQGYQQGMPPQPGPNDVAFVASCVGNTASCDGSCYFDAVGGGWSLHEEPGYPAFSGTCGQEPDYTYCADDRISCVDDKLACVGDIYFCVNNIEGQDMPTYCIPKASFNAETQAKIGEYIGAENCAAGCAGDGTCPGGCANGLTCCKTKCVDTQTDKANCGGCGGGPCSDSEACKNGSCSGCPSPCAEGETCCEGGTRCCKVCCNDGCCADSDYCGAGGGCVECECTVPGTTCCGGECCAAGTVCCGSGNSKACCTADQYCDGNGHCTSCQTPVCYPDETCCSGTCVANLCGECPNSCQDGIVCCGLPHHEVCCSEGQDCCDNNCTDIGTDTDCSGCGNACSITEKCCDGSCIDVWADLENCGGCGVVAEELCCDGVPTPKGTNENCLSCGDTADPDNATNPTSCCPQPVVVAGAPDTSTFFITNTNTDDKNCGGCGNAADTSPQVQEKCCKGEIVSLLTDPDNCGGCGVRVVDPMVCCPTWGPPNAYGDLPTPTSGPVDTQTDNAHCGGCNQPCNSVESGTECPNPDDPPTTKCVDGNCVPCGTCKLPTEQQQSQLLGSAPTFWGQRTTIACTYDACPIPPLENGDPAPTLPAKTCFGGCDYKAVGNVNNLQWELISCICYDSCNLPECNASNPHAIPCPSVGFCQAGEGPCAGCRYLDYVNPSSYKCYPPWGHDVLGSCNYNVLAEQYGVPSANYVCCDRERTGGTVCNGGCPSVYEDNSEHFPTCPPCGGSCPAGLTCCGDFPNDTCVDTKTDEGHCGSCPNVCLAGQTCCDGACKNTDNDKDHCGSCPNKCTGDLECCGGECKDIHGSDDSNCGSCGQTCATGHCCGGECKDTDTDESNCGPLCVACGAGETCCGGSCVNTDTDEENCGECGIVCTGGGTCCVGTCRDSSYFQTNEANCGGCEQPCAAGETCCAGTCIATSSLQTDEANCGDCGIVCAAGQICCGGTCRNSSYFQTNEANCGGCGQPCAAGETCCSGSCIATSSLQTDEANCGDCGIVCTAGQTCCAGTCRDSSYFQTSDANCGECGNACEPGEECLLGSCNLPPLTIKVYFQAYGCSGDCPPPYDSPSCGSSVLSSGSRSVSYTTTWGASGSISNSSSTITLGIANVPVGTALTIYLSGYVSGSASHTRAATYPGSPPTHTFYFNGYDDLNC